MNEMQVLASHDGATALANHIHHLGDAVEHRVE
jgi:hypothetical protein